MYMVLGSFTPPNTPKPIVLKKNRCVNIYFLILIDIALFLKSLLSDLIE